MIALVTCAEMPQGDTDDAPLPAAVGGEWVVWDDPAVDWGAYELVVVRSAWDYQLRREEFLEWARALPRIVNPAEVLEWNTDKRYVAELAAAGLPVVPTSFAAPGEEVAVPAGEFVVKPTVSAGSRDTQRFAPGDDPSALVARIHGSGRSVMLQPYLDGVDDHGETALLYFGGDFSHAIRKAPILEPGTEPTDELFAPESITPRTPSVEERAVADRVVAVVTERFGPLAYVRVDLIPGPEGPVLLELELTEPSLFFSHADGAVERFAAALGVS